jgi:CheY-like chemotaxis protein
VSRSLPASAGTEGTAVILAPDAVEWDCLPAVLSALRAAGPVSIAMLAAPGGTAEEDLRRIHGGCAVLPFPVSDRAVRRFLARPPDSADGQGGRLTEAFQTVTADGVSAPPAAGGWDKPVSAALPVVPPRLLLVEDNAVNQTVALAMLQMARRYRVDVAKDGYSALARLTEQRYDLILMDVEMPEMNGLETTRRIRRMTTGASALPIIGMTAHAFAEDRDRCLAAGMDDYISKPVDRRQLLEKISRWLGQGTSRAAEPCLQG